MALINVVRADEPIHVETIVAYYYADPDIGKSSLAFTANAPILFDFDKGVHRVGALRRGTAVQVQKWTDVSNVTEEDLKPFKTVVFDTVGTMLDCVKIYYQGIKGNTQRDGNLTLKAQGYAGNDFISLINRIRSYGKDIVFIGHAEEQRNDDLLIHRPSMTGKNRDVLYRISDIMAYLTYEKAADGQIVRVLKFQASNSHHAKNSGNLGADTGGNIVLPDLMQAQTFFADLIQQAKDHLNTMTPAQLETMKAIEQRDQFFAECDQAIYASSINELCEQLDKDHVHYLEMRKFLKAKSLHLGFVYDKEKQKFIDPKQNTFYGTSPEQRDHIQELLAQLNIDIVAFCEEQGIDSLMGIEADRFNDVVTYINTKTNQGTATA